MKGRGRRIRRGREIMVYLGNLERKDNPSTPLGRIAPFKGGISPKDLKHSRESSTLHPKKSLHWCIGKTTEKRFYFNSPVYICSAVPRAAQASITSAVKSSQKSAEETQQMQQLHQKQMHTCQKKKPSRNAEMQSTSSSLWCAGY